MLLLSVLTQGDKLAFAAVLRIGPQTLVWSVVQGFNMCRSSINVANRDVLVKVEMLQAASLP